MGLLSFPEWGPHPSTPGGCAGLGENSVPSSHGVGTLLTVSGAAILLLLGLLPRPLHMGPRRSSSYFDHQRKEPVLGFTFRTREFGKSRVIPRTGALPWCKWMAGLSELLQQSEISPLGFCIFRVILQHPRKYIFIFINVYLCTFLSLIFILKVPCSP